MPDVITSYTAAGLVTLVLAVVLVILLAIIEYTASQDLGLLGRSPEEINPVHSLSVKYDPRNPANSIVVCP